MISVTSRLIVDSYKIRKLRVLGSIASGTIRFDMEPSHAASLADAMMELELLDSGRPPVNLEVQREG